MTYKESWKQTEHRVEFLKNSKESMKFDFHKKLFEYFDEARQNLEQVSKLFNVSNEEIKEEISYQNSLLHCKEQELIEKYQIFLSFFKTKDCLLEMIKIDQINLDRLKHLNRFEKIEYDGLFSIASENFFERVSTIKSLFYLSDEDITRFFRSSASYLAFSGDKLKKRIDDLSLIFDCEFQKVIEILLINPHIIDCCKGLVFSRVARLSNYFSCTEEETLKMYKEYPLSMFYTPSDIDSILRYKSCRTQDIKDAIRQYPWVLECIWWEKGREYGDFLSIEQLISCSKFIVEYFGNVVHVYKRRKIWNNKDVNYCTFLLTKNSNNRYYLLCLGTLSPEERLLRALFSEHRSYDIFYIKVKNDEIFDLNRYIQYLYLGIRTGKRGVRLKNDMVLNQYPAFEFGADCNSGFQFAINEDNFVKFQHIVILNEFYSKKHQEYYQKVDNTQKDEEFEEIDFSVDDDDEDEGEFDVKSIFEEDGDEEDGFNIGDADDDEEDFDFNDLFGIDNEEDDGFKSLNEDKKEEKRKVDNQTGGNDSGYLLNKKKNNPIEEYFYEVFGTYENMIDFLKGLTHI